MASTANDHALQAAALTLSVAPRLTRWIQTRMGSEDQPSLSMRQLSALNFIGSPDATLGDIARNLNVTPAVVTGLVDRLERRGYVRRVSSQHDRRRVHIELTPEGEDVRESAQARLAQELGIQFASLENGASEQLAAGLAILEDVIESLELDQSKPRS
jgi:DNA-binding MarR family transcriptional regulator